MERAHLISEPTRVQMHIRKGSIVFNGKAQQKLHHTFNHSDLKNVTSHENSIVEISDISSPQQTILHLEVTLVHCL